MMPDINKTPVENKSEVLVRPLVVVELLLILVTILSFLGACASHWTDGIALAFLTIGSSGLLVIVTIVHVIAMVVTILNSRKNNQVNQFIKSDGAAIAIVAIFMLLVLFLYLSGILFSIIC